MIGRNATHVVVHGGQYRYRLPGHVYVGKDASAFGDAGQFLVDDFGAEMSQVEQDVILFRTDAASFANLDGHRPADHIA